MSANENKADDRQNEADARHLSRLILASIVAALWASAGAGQTLSNGPGPATTGSTAKAANKDFLIVGHGTSGNIARFKAPFELGDSAFFQSPLGGDRRLELAQHVYSPLLVTSSLPGHAMKGTDSRKMFGAVVGKALQSIETGTGVIQVLVTLR